MPDPLPWSEVLRRRNGLPPELAVELAEATAQQPDHIRYALVPLADLIAATEDEPDPDLSLLTISPGMLRAYLGEPPLSDLLVTVTADTTAAMRGLNRLAAAERRCPHTDLPTTMCHHCKETDHAQP